MRRCTDEGPQRTRWGPSGIIHFYARQVSSRSRFPRNRPGHTPEHAVMWFAATRMNDPSGGQYQAGERSRRYGIREAAFQAMMHVGDAQSLYVIALLLLASAMQVGVL